MTPTIPTAGWCKLVGLCLNIVFLKKKSLTTNLKHAYELLTPPMRPLSTRRCKNSRWLLGSQSSYIHIWPMAFSEHCGSFHCAIWEDPSKLWPWPRKRPDINGRVWSHCLLYTGDKLWWIKLNKNQGTQYFWDCVSQGWANGRRRFTR